MSDTAGPGVRPYPFDNSATLPGSRSGDPVDEKEPLLSMWLSGANALAGRARSAGTAEAKRQQTSLAKQATRLWSAWLPDTKPKAKAKRR